MQPLTLRIPFFKLARERPPKTGDLFAFTGTMKGNTVDPLFEEAVEVAYMFRASGQPNKQYVVVSLGDVAPVSPSGQVKKSNVNTTAEEAEPPPLLGSNPKGDVIRWQDGTVWRNVTVKQVEVPASGLPSLEVTNVPNRFQAGTFTNFVSVALRGEIEPPPAATNPASLLKIYGASLLEGSNSAAASFAPLKAEFGDVLISDMPTDFAQMMAAPVKPEFTATLTRNGKQLFGRFEVTITHLTAERGQVLCLVRGTKKNATIRDGWYSGVQLAIFGREASQ